MTVQACGMHEAYVRDRVSGARIGAVVRLLAVRWQRLLDDVSSADVTVALEDCCGFIDSVHTWRHELVVARDGVPVWSGPIVRLEVTREEAVLYAWDQLAWLSRRAVVTEATLELDVARIAERLVTDAMNQQDDVDLVELLDVRETGIIEEREYRAGTQTVLEALRELATGPIDFTAVGRRVVIGGELGLGNVPTFTDDDFAEDLRVVEDGLSLYTGFASRGRDDDVVEIVGGPSDYYGLLQGVGLEQDSLTTEAGVISAGERFLGNRAVAPRYVQTPAGATLSPASTQDLGELVPGVRARITSVASCIDVSNVYKLSGLEVAETADSGELIAVSFTTLDALPDPLWPR